MKCLKNSEELWFAIQNSIPNLPAACEGRIKILSGTVVKKLSTHKSFLEKLLENVLHQNERGGKKTANLEKKNRSCNTGERYWKSLNDEEGRPKATVLHQAQRQKAGAARPSEGLNLELVQCHFCCILWAKESHKTSPDVV